MTAASVREPVVDVAVFGEPLSRVFGHRFVGCTLYGSTVTGGFLPGVSDVDLLVAVSGGITVDDASRLRDALTGIDGDWCRVQAAYMNIEDRAHEVRLVPQSFVAYQSEPPESVISSTEDVLRMSRSWLMPLPAVVRSDISDWSVCSSSEADRFARLVFTRIKPSVRAILTPGDPDPFVVWRGDWDNLVDGLVSIDADCAARIGDLIATLAEKRTLRSELVPEMLDLNERLASIGRSFT